MSPVTNSVPMENSDEIVTKEEKISLSNGTNVEESVVSYKFCQRDPTNVVIGRNIDFKVSKVFFLNEIQSFPPSTFAVRLLRELMGDEAIKIYSWSGKRVNGRKK